MDLSSLLNNQKDNTISLSDLQVLLEKNDNTSTLEKIRTSTTYVYPSNRQESFLFFDYFIRVILSIVSDDDPYHAQYTKSIIIDSLRSCIKGIIDQYDITWLTQFSHYFTRQTWSALHDNMTVLVYLYGLVLALLREPQSINTSNAWILGMIQFMRSNSAALMSHLWLNCCTFLEDEADYIHQGDVKKIYIDFLEKGVRQKIVSLTAIQEMWTILKESNAPYLSTQLDQQWGSGLVRASFTKDEVMLGYICFKDVCQDRSIMSQFYTPLDTLDKNPLLNQDILAATPADKHAQTKAIQKGTLFWIQQMSTIASQAFDMHLKNLILDHYPTDQKSILDLLLSDWTMRDRFHRHLDVVMDTLLSQLDQKKYNIRTCPYYAFVQLFSLSEPQNNSINNTTYQIKSGAFIDLSQFSNCTDSVLMQGCCKVLQKMTLYPNPNHQVTDWAADCLKSASADIIQFYTGWLTQGLERELATQSSNTFHQYAKFTLLLLNTCVTQSTHVVPTLLQTLSDTGLQWLLQTHRKSASILLHYFDDESQVSKDMVVTQLLSTKTKSFIDLLLNYLRDMMSGTDPKLPRSRRWFKNHFLKNVLLLVCEQADTSVSACLFRQWFKTRDDFEWYFSTPLPQQITLDGLDLTRSHRIYGIKHTGLAAMFQDMVGDHVKKERLIQIWFDLWVSDHTFTVPVSWILQCTGLYDQAPVLMKQMIKKLIYVGIQHTGFLDAMMDLVLLSDAPEPDSLFELILEVACETQGIETTYKRINANIIHLMIELSEELDLATTVQPSNTAEKKLSKKQRRKLKKHGKLPHNKLRSMMRKHEEELEKYLRESNTSTHNNGCLKALTTLVQRLFNFLLRLLLSVSTVDSTNNSLSIKQDVQRQLMSTPLFYEPLAKFVKLIRQPEDLQEDIQATIDISTDYLKRLSDLSLFKASQNIMHEQIN